LAKSWVFEFNHFYKPTSYPDRHSPLLLGEGPGVRSSNKLTITFEVFIVSVMFILILASLTVAIGFLIAFLWAVQSGQYDDKYTPKLRILLDEKKRILENESNSDINKRS
jgi:cbb3-type cytochrome oxidase maturation protein